MGITGGKLLYCHGVAEGNMDKKFSTLEYNNRTVYYCFNNLFTAHCGSPAMHLTPSTIDDRPRLHKSSWYNPDLLPASISVASETSSITLTTPSDSPDILTSYYLNTLHVMNKYLPFQGRVHRGYWCRKDGQKYATKRQGSFSSYALIRTRKFVIFIGFPGLFHRQGLSSWKINIIYHNFFSWLLCLSPFHTLLYRLNFFCACFLPFPLITPCNIYCISDMMDYLILYCFLTVWM